MDDNMGSKESEPMMETSISGLVVETRIPLVLLDGVPLVAFETPMEYRRAKLESVEGAAMEEIPLVWDSEIAALRKHERLGLLKANRERNAITGYMRQAYPGRLSGCTDVAEAVVMEMESRWSRKLSRLLGAFGPLKSRGGETK